MIIIVMGLPGSGKSYFAEKLAKMLNAKYLSSDRVRNVINMKGKYSLSEKMHVYQWLADLTEGALEEYSKVVIDASFYLNQTRDLFLQIAQRHQVPIQFILIETPLYLLKKRLEKPRKDSEADYLVYEKIKKEFEEMTLPCLHLTSLSNNINSMLDTARKFILTESNESL